MEVEDVVTISSKGQIVIPKQVRQKLGLRPGKKLLLATSNQNEILLKTIDNLTLEEINSKTNKVLAVERINADALVAEAIRWARKKSSPK